MTIVFVFVFVFVFIFFFVCLKTNAMTTAIYLGYTMIDNRSTVKMPLLNWSV